MKVKILGFKKYDFKDNATGNQITGVSVYYAFADSQTTGLATAKASISNPDMWRELVAIAGSPEKLVNMELLFHFNNYGRLSAVSKLG